MPRKSRVVCVIGRVIGWLGAGWILAYVVAAGLKWLGVGAASVALRWLEASSLNSWPVFAAMGCMAAGALLEAWGKRLGSPPSA